MNNKEFPKKVAENVILYSSNPIIYVVKDFIEHKECKAFIEEFESESLGGFSKTKNDKKKSLNQKIINYSIDHNANDHLHSLSKRLSILAQIPIRNAEPYELTHYQQGAQTSALSEAFDVDCKTDHEKLSQGGQRVLSTVFFLNEKGEGNGIEFPNLQLSILVKQGDVLVLHNTIDASHHSGHPVMHPNAIHAPISTPKDTQLIVYLRFREGIFY